MSVKVEDVTYCYEGAAAPALDAVSLEVKKGELAVVCGKNGSGKSTLLRCMAGLAAPSRGRALIDGQEAALARQKIGFAIQFPERALFERTVFDEVAFGPRNRKLPAETVRGQVESALEAVGLSGDLLSTPPRSLSYGHKRLAAIASVIATGPQYLFLDEPAAGLDFQGKLRIAGLIASLDSTGMTIVVSTHDPAPLLPACDRLLALDGGRLTLDGPPSPQNAISAGVRSDTLELARRLKGCGWKVEETIDLDELADSIAEVIRSESARGG